MSGSVSVSTKALRELPLPRPCDVRVAFKKKLTDDEAAELAYARSLARADKKQTHAPRRR
jgi:hypothetical protein